MLLFNITCSYRETCERASSPHEPERIQQPNHQTVPSGIYSFNLKPCPPKDHCRTSASSKQRNRLVLISSPTPVSPPDTTHHRTQDRHFVHDHSNGKLFSRKSSLRSRINLIDSNSSNAELNSLSSALEPGDLSKKYTWTSTSRLVSAAGESEASIDLIKQGVTKDSDLGHLKPTPPAVQKTASRGLRGSRRLCVPQPDSLLSSLWLLQVILTWRFSVSVTCDNIDNSSHLAVVYENWFTWCKKLWLKFSSTVISMLLMSCWRIIVVSWNCLTWWVNLIKPKPI